MNLILKYVYQNTMCDNCCNTFVNLCHSDAKGKFRWVLYCNQQKQVGLSEFDFENMCIKIQRTIA